MAIVSFVAMVAAFAMAFGGYSNGEKLEMPPECKGESFCTIQTDSHAAKVPAMEKAIKESPNLDRPQEHKRYRRNRNDFFVDYDENCASVTQEYTPYMISVETTDPETKHVLQSNIFKQTVHQTTCLNKNAPCFDTLTMNQDASEAIETGCTEVKSSIELYVFNGTGIEPVTIDVSVACVCSVKFTNV